MNAFTTMARLGLCVALLAAFGAAQNKKDDDPAKQAELKKLRAEKVQKEVFGKAKWTFDFDVARAESKRTGKLIFAYFTRSYVNCGPCEALEGGALSDDEFPKFAESVVLFVHNTSHCADEKYPTLLREKGFTGFPSLCFMDQDGNVLVRPSDRTVAGFAATLAKLRRVDELRKKADAGDAAAARDLLFAELEMQSLTAEAIKQRADKLKLEQADLDRVDQFVVDAELRELRSRRGRDDAAKMQDAIVAMAHSGRRPTPQGIGAFWEPVLAWCSVHGEPELAQQAFDALQQQRLPAAVKKRQEEMLEKAKAAVKKQ